MIESVCNRRFAVPARHGRSDDPSARTSRQSDDVSQRGSGEM